MNQNRRFCRADLPADRIGKQKADRKAKFRVHFLVK